MRQRKNRWSQAGITLIEIMVVVAIFGILAALSWNALSPTHHEFEVRGTASQLAMTFKNLRLRAISQGLVHALVINFDDTTDYSMAGKSRAYTNGWVSFQGNMPRHQIGTTEYGNERVLEVVSPLRGTIDGGATFGYALVALSSMSTRDEKTSASQSFVDVFGTRNCVCASDCSTCPAPAQRLDQVWFLFYPDGSIRLKDLPDQAQFSIYFGMSKLVTNNYSVVTTGVTTDSPNNAHYRWKVTVHKNTGRVKLMKGWINTDV